MIYLISVLLAVLAVLALTVLLVPIRLRLILNDRTRTVALGWLMIQVARDLKERTYVLYLGSRAIMRKESRKTEKREPNNKKTAEDKDRKKSKFNLTYLWRERDLAEKVIQACLVLVWNVFKSIRWDKFMLDVNLSTPDPALTGFLYGELCAIKYSTQHAFPQAQIDVRPDFTRELPRANTESILSIKPLNLLVPLSKLFLALPKMRMIKLLIRRKRR
jgi:hypothetical protein